MISLRLAKKHLNIDESFKDDDFVLMHYLETAEAVMKKDLDIVDEKEIFDQYGEYKTEFVQAVLLLVGTWYANRETVSYGAASILPHSFEYLNALNHNWEWRDTKTKE